MEGLTLSQSVDLHASQLTLLPRIKKSRNSTLPVILSYIERDHMRPLLSTASRSSRCYLIKAYYIVMLRDPLSRALLFGGESMLTRVVQL